MAVSARRAAPQRDKCGTGCWADFADRPSLFVKSGTGPVCGDDHVLACATPAQAQLIVSRDKDLLDLCEHQGIPILASADALQRLETQQHNS